MRQMYCAGLALIVTLAVSTTARAEAPFHAWEVGTAAEFVSLGYDPDTNDAGQSGFGGRPFFMSGSLIGLLADLESKRFMFGDYYYFGIGGWYGDGTEIRMPISLGLQAGYALNGDYQLVLRGGLGGMAASAGGGGYGTIFGEARVKHDFWAGELSFAPRMDSGTSSFARLLGLTGRLYVENFNVFCQVKHAKRLNDPPEDQTIRDFSVLLGISVEYN